MRCVASLTAIVLVLAVLALSAGRDDGVRVTDADNGGNVACVIADDTLTLEYTQAWEAEESAPVVTYELDVAAE